MASELTREQRRILEGNIVTEREYEDDAIAAALQTIDSLAAQLAARAAEVERLKEYDAELGRCEVALEKWPLSSGCNGHLCVAGHIKNILTVIADRDAEVESLRERLQSAERLAARVIEIFQPMQDKGQNGHTFELLLDRAKMFALAQQEHPHADG